MRKLIILGLVTFVLISISALGITWLNRANAVKKDIADQLAILNTGDSRISYEAITASGFPFSMNISIVKPHFTGRIDKLLENLHMKEALRISTLPEWSEDYTLDGSIDLNVNALSNKFKMVMRGNWAGKGNINGKTVALTSQSAGDSTCSLELKRTSGMFDNLWNFYSLRDNRETFIENFRSFDCVNTGGKMINDETKEVISSYDGMRVYLTRAPQAGGSSIRFYLQVKDVETTKSYDDIYAIYSQAFYPNKPFSLPSVYGKQNIEFDISYNGTEDWKNPEARNIPLEIKINKFYISSAVYQTTMNLSLTHELKNDTRNANITFRIETTATELLRTLLKDKLREAADSVISGEAPLSSEIKEKLANLSPEAVDKLILSIIPDFASLGKMVEAIDASYSGTKDFTSSQVNLALFEFSATPYGLTATGSANRDKSNPVPSGNLSISCNNCLKMIDDAIDYFKRVQAAAHIFNSEKSVVTDISPESVQAVKDVLLELSKQGASEDKNNLKFDIINSGAAELTINGRKLSDVMGLFGNRVEPTLKKK